MIIELNLLKSISHSFFNLHCTQIQIHDFEELPNLEEGSILTVLKRDQEEVVRITGK